MNKKHFGVWNNVKKEFQFGIDEPTETKALNKLFKKIGNDARKWRFEIREIPNDYKKKEKRKMNFDAFDKKVNLTGLQEDIVKAEQNAPSGEYAEIPKGKYEVSFKNIELGTTKDGRPMLKVDAVILEGEFKKSHLFMNRVIFGTKNDANMIQSALGWLKTLGTDKNISFEGYQKFSELVLDIMESIDGKFEYLVEYDPKAFNNISIKEVFEIE